MKNPLYRVILEGNPVPYYLPIAEQLSKKHNNCVFFFFSLIPKISNVMKSFAYKFGIIVGTIGLVSGCGSSSGSSVSGAETELVSGSVQKEGVAGTGTSVRTESWDTTTYLVGTKFTNKELTSSQIYDLIGDKNFKLYAGDYNVSISAWSNAFSIDNKIGFWPKDKFGDMLNNYNIDKSTVFSLYKDMHIPDDVPNYWY